MTRLSRREFFRASGILAIGAFAAACAKKITPRPSLKTLKDITGGHQQSVNMNVAGFEVLSGTPDRLVFNLIDPSNGNAVTLPTVQLYMAQDLNSAATGPLAATYRAEGLPADKGFYEVRLTIPKDGTWLAVVVAEGNGRTDYGSGQFQVGRQTAMPKEGDHAVIVPTPTVKNHLGVNPICTANPPCSMHTISLDAALKNGKPTVFIIATPKFCTSQLCGPETTVVETVAKGFAGRVNFIHAEVYKDDKPATIQQQLVSPAARAWHLDQEPVIYYIDSSGIIKARTIGPADKAEVQEAVTTLAG